MTGSPVLVSITCLTNIYHFPSTKMCQWFVTKFLDINTEILAPMTGEKAVSSNHVFNHFLTPLLSYWWEFLSRLSSDFIFWFV